MTTKLCPRCKTTLPLGEFGRRHKKGRLTTIPQCKKCRCEMRLQWKRTKDEMVGELFMSARQRDPDRADRLDRFRSMAKQGLPLTIEPTIILEETDEYHLFYIRNKIV